MHYAVHNQLGTADTHDVLLATEEVTDAVPPGLHRVVGGFTGRMSAYWVCSKEVAVLLDDVGAAVGHPVLLLKDLAAVVDGAPLTAAVTRMP